MTLQPAEHFVPFQFPALASLGPQGQVIPREQLYQQARPGQHVRQLFSQQVASVRWRYKLAPDTLNIAGSQAVAEIQVLDIHLKPGCRTLDTRLLACLDKAIPSTLFFRLYRQQGGVQCAMACKAAGESHSSGPLAGLYACSRWLNTAQDTDQPRQKHALPVAQNMTALYTALLRSLLPAPGRSGESLPAQLQRIGQQLALQRELATLQQKQRREKQFNRQVELNQQINQLKQQLRAAADAAPDSNDKPVPTVETTSDGTP